MTNCLKMDYNHCLSVGEAHAEPRRKHDCGVRQQANSRPAGAAELAEDTKANTACCTVPTLLQQPCSCFFNAKSLRYSAALVPDLLHQRALPHQVEWHASACHPTGLNDRQNALHGLRVADLSRWREYQGCYAHSNDSNAPQWCVKAYIGLGQAFPGADKICRWYPGCRWRAVCHEIQQKH